MARKEYTQTVKPVSRIAERIFGWLAWIALLAIAGFALYFSFVSVDDPRVIDSVQQTAEQVSQTQGMEDVTPDQLADMTIAMLGQVWMVALYLALPLILGLFGLLTMRRRILAGFLLLFAGIFSAPLVFLVVTGLIPLFFIIASILLFVRKDMIVRDEDLDSRDVKKMRKENDKLEKERVKEEERRQQVENDLERDDTKRYDYDDNHARTSRETDSDDLESTRQFTKINDDEIKDYEDNKSQNNQDDLKRYDYDESDAASERRSNVDRRNSDQ
jgi:hypothetical protein